MSHLPQRKKFEVVNLEHFPFLHSRNYRFEWISEKPKNKKSQLLNTPVSNRNINLPLGHFLSGNHNSFIDSKIAHSNEGKKNNNSPVTTIQGRKTTDNLSQRNKSYTIVNINVDKLLQKKGLNSSIEYKTINIFDQSQIENKIKNKDNILKTKKIDSSQKNKKVDLIKCVKYTMPMQVCKAKESTELQSGKDNATTVTPKSQNDLKDEMDLCENDNIFEITLLNNHQIETKTIII